MYVLAFGTVFGSWFHSLILYEPSFPYFSLFLHLNSFPQFVSSFRVGHNYSSSCSWSKLISFHFTNSSFPLLIPSFFSSRSWSFILCVLYFPLFGLCLHPFLLFFCLTDFLTPQTALSSFGFVLILCPSSSTHFLTLRKQFYPLLLSTLYSYPLPTVLSSRPRSWLFLSVASLPSGFPSHMGRRGQPRMSPLRHWGFTARVQT